MNQFSFAAVPVIGFVHGAVRPPLGLPLAQDDDVPHGEALSVVRRIAAARVLTDRPDLSRSARDHQ